MSYQGAEKSNTPCEICGRLVTMGTWFWNKKNDKPMLCYGCGKTEEYLNKPIALNEDHAKTEGEEKSLPSDTG